jgi:hypothetical protein
MAESYVDGPNAQPSIQFHGGYITSTIKMLDMLCSSSLFRDERDLKELHSSTSTQPKKPAFADRAHLIDAYKYFSEESQKHAEGSNL